MNHLQQQYARPSSQWKRLSGVLAAVLLLGWIPAARGANGSWILDTNGNWSDTSKWAGGIVADGTGGSATFNLPITATRTTTLDSTRTVGGLVFGNAGSYIGQNWTLSGSSALTLSSSATPTITCWPLKSTGNSACTISVPLSGVNGFTKAGTGTLWLDGNNLGLGGTLTIVAGRVFNYNANGLGSMNVSIAAGSYLSFWTGGTFAGNFTLNGLGGTIDGQIKNALYADNGSGAQVVLNGSVTLNVATDVGGSTAAASFTLNGQVSGLGGLIKQTSCVLTLNGANNYAGGMTLNAGQLNINNGGTGLTNSAIGTGPLTISGGAMDNTSAADAVLASNNQQNWNGDFSYLGSLHNLNLGAGTVTLGSNRQVTVNSNILTVGGPIGDSGNGYGLTKAGAGTLALNGVNTYSGGTTISAGTLALGSGASLGNTLNLAIAAGATLDVSASSSYNCGSNTLLMASGSGTTVGSTAAAIKGAPGGAVNLGSCPVMLQYDGLHPALYVFQGSLALNGNAFVINSSSPLAAGTYTIIQQTAGNVLASGSFSVTGTAIAWNMRGLIAVNDASVNLVVQTSQIADYQLDFRTGGFPSGWRYLWNQPNGWPSAPDNTTGTIGDPSSYANLQASGSLYTPDGDQNFTNSPPAGYLQLASSGGHPGNAAGGAGERDRYAIAAYTVPFSGYFKLTNSMIQQSSASSSGLNLIAHVDANPFAANLITYSTNACSFDTLLGFLNAGQTIYVAVGPDGNSAYDSFALEFSVATYDPTGTTNPWPLTTRYSQAFSGTPSQTNGWSFSWNAPVGWASGGASGDQTSGGIASGAAYQPLLASDGTLTPDGDLNFSNNIPAGSLYLNASGGHPGAAGNYGTVSRYAIASYQVPLAGTYQIGRSFLNLSTNSHDGVEVMVLVNGVRQYTQTVVPGGREGFDGELGPLTNNDVIQVAVGPRGDDLGDDFTWDFEIAYATANFSASAPVVNVSSYGAVGNGVTDDGPAIRAAIAAAGNSGVPTVVAFDGTKTYRVASFAGGLAMDLTGMRDLYLQGNGATISVLPPNQFLKIYGAQNIKVDGFTLTYSPLPYFQANIVGYNTASNTVDIQVWTNYPMPAVDAAGVTNNSTTWQFGQSFGGYVSHFWINTVKAINAANTSNRVLRVSAQPQSTNIVASVGQNTAGGLIMPNPGYGQKGNFTVQACYSSQVQFTNVVVRQAPQFIFVVYGNNGPVRFQKIALQVPPGTQERLVSWRDGFHVKDNRYGPVWEDSTLDGWALQDDCYNLTAMWSFVSAINGNNPQLLTLNYSGVGPTQFAPGDWLREENMDGTSKGAAQIVSAVLSGNTLYVQLGGALPGLAVGDRLFDEQRSNRGAIIRRCQSTSGDAGRGGGRLRTPVLLQDNNFQDWYMWVAAESAAEGPIPEDITFRRNLFNYASRVVDVGYLSGARAVHDIAFADNTFNLSNLGLLNAYDVQFWANNFILNGATVPVTMNNAGVATYIGNAVNGSVPGSFLSYITCTGGTVAATDLVFTNLLTLSGTVTNGGQVWLDWTPGAAVTNYLVQRCTTNGGPYSTLASVRLDTDYLDSVTNGVTYYYRIQAINTNGVSAFSSPISLPVPGNGPPVIGSIPNYTIGPGMTLGFTIPATDTNAPPEALSYWLSSGPTGATLNLTNGCFAWSVPATLANTTNLVSVQVGNNGVPPMSTTQSFAVIVTAAGQAMTLSFQAGGLRLNGAVTAPGYASQDVHLQSSSPALSDPTTLISGNQYNSGGAWIHHSLLSFDLSGLLAVTGGNAFTIQNVQLVLTNFAINFGPGLAGISQELHLTDPFAAGATWNTYDGVNAWPTAGGTVGNLLGSVFIGSTGTQTWSSSSNFIAAVNAALGGTDHHLYLLLQGAYQSNQDNRSQFSNRTATNQVNRPRLDVSFTVQTPASPALSFQLNQSLFVLWWPTNYVDYVLQNQFLTLDLHRGAWMDVSGVTSNRYVQPIGSSNVFFRLRQAP